MCVLAEVETSETSLEAVRARVSHSDNPPLRFSLRSSTGTVWLCACVLPEPEPRRVAGSVQCGVMRVFRRARASEERQRGGVKRLHNDSA